MKKLVHLAIAILISQCLAAQQSSLFRKLLDPVQHYFVDAGYTDVGDKELWNIFKPDSIWFSSGYFYLDYTDNKDLLKVTYDITSSYDDEYQYGRYSTNFEYDAKGRLVNNGSSVWKYLEDDNYSDDSISNAKRLQIPVFHDEYGGKKEDMMLDLIYDAQDRLSRFIYSTYYDGTTWREDEISYYDYNDKGEISAIRRYNRQGELTYHFKDIEWYNFKEEKFSFYKMDDFVAMYAPDYYRVSVEYSDTGWTEKGEEYYLDEWHSKSRKNYIVTDSSVIYENPSDSRREILHDEFGNPAGEIYYSLDGYSKEWEISQGQLWETDYENGIAIRTTYSYTDGDGEMEEHHTEAYRYKNSPSITTGIRNQQANTPNFIVYPSIAENRITVQQNSNSAYLVNIYSITGSSVYQNTMQNQENEIDITQFKPGIYFLQVTQDSVSERIRFIKK